MVTVHLPRSLVTLFADPPPRLVEIDVGTLGDMIAALDERWPGMHERICDPGPQLREHINVFVDGERERDLSASLAAGATVHVIPAVAGG